MLLKIISDTADIKLPDVSSWELKYSTSDWFYDLNILSNISKINEYYDEVQDILDECTRKIETNFNDAEDVSDAFISTIEEKFTTLQQAMELLE